MYGADRKERDGPDAHREAIHFILDSFHVYFDRVSTHFLVKRAAKQGAKSMIRVALPIVDVVIADANKPYVLEHAHAIDDLVSGLFVDDGNPRRTQDGADKVQELCAHALQCLALSDIGKTALRSHADVLPSLRKVATAEGGLSDEARQFASGALFELDEEARRKAKEAAKSKLHKRLADRQQEKALSGEDGSSSDNDGEGDTEHVMLSYNWDHQSVIKRLNTALKARGYSIWIDIEKMQGSTVEAMANAVEDAAVMCYGISQAYKESTNCRMEAQYAFQQQVDMVPLMMEQGYQAKGWLGMLLGVRLWYGFYESVLESEAAFEGKTDELCRELGERGKAA